MTNDTKKNLRDLYQERERLMAALRKIDVAIVTVKALDPEARGRPAKPRAER